MDESNVPKYAGESLRLQLILQLSKQLSHVLSEDLMSYLLPL